MKDRQVDNTHKLAMGLVDYARTARRYGDAAVAEELLQRALHYETEAAKMMDEQASDELWRAVLYQSAASLAMQCGEWDESERLIQIGLAGNTPKTICDELLELREEVRKLRGAKEHKPLSRTHKQPA
jgi:hypothetical protein